MALCNRCEDKDKKIEELERRFSDRSECTGSVPVRVYSRVSEECGKCKDRSVAKDTLRWVLDVIREEQNDNAQPPCG